MANINDAIRKVTEAMRDTAFYFFQFQPLNKTIIDTYNEFVNVTLEDIIKQPISFETKTTFGIVEFNNIIRVPPMKGSIIRESINAYLKPTRDANASNEANRMKQYADMIKENEFESLDDERILRVEAEIKAKELSEEHELLRQYYGQIPRNSWCTAADSRRQDLSYMLEIYVDVTMTENNRRMVEETITRRNIDEDNPDNEVVDDADIFDPFNLKMNALQDGVEVRSEQFVKLFEIPLMTGSTWDWLILSGVPPEQWSHFNECNLSPLSNFILNGNEKVFITQVKLAPNIPRCKIIKGGKTDAPVIIAELRCEARTKRFSTIKLDFVKPKGKTQVKMKTLMMSLPFLMKGEKKDMTFNFLWIFRIYAIWSNQILGEEEFTDGQSITIMLGEFNRYLVDICTTPDNPEDINCYRKVVDGLLDTIRFASITDKNDVEFIENILVMANMPKYSHGVAVLKLKAHFDAEFMPHIVVTKDYDHKNLQGEISDPYPRFAALVQMVVKYVKCFNGAKSVDDLDHPGTQQLATAGIEMGILVFKAFNMVRIKIRNELSEGTSTFNFKNITTFGESSVTNPIMKSFIMGQWGLERGVKRPGVVQPHDITSPLSQWSLIRKVAIPTKKKSQIAKPRLVHPLTYGIIDPTNTPDSAQVGLVRELASSVYIPPDNVNAYNTIYNLIETKLDEEDDAYYTREPDTYPFMLNNVIICYSGISIIKELKIMKKKGLIGYYTEIFMKIEIDKWETVREIHVLTTAGRAMRPLFMMDENGDFDTDAVIKNSRNFEALLNSGIIEYISAGEFEFSDTAETYEVYVRKTSFGRKFTHIELDPYMSMSVETATQPFPGLNPNPRVMYYASMSKQPISVPMATFLSRQDTDFKVLNYPHKPLITTDMSKILSLDKQPFGNNVIVAIKSMSGTDEDPTVWKKEFLERGGLNGTLYETYDFSTAVFVGDPEDDPAIYNNGLIRIRRARRATEEEIQHILNGEVIDNVYVDPSDLLENQDILESSEEDILKAANKIIDVDQRQENRFSNFNLVQSEHASIQVAPGDSLAKFKIKNDDSSEVEKIKLVGKRHGFIHSTHISGRNLDKKQKIIVRFPHVPKQGDKFANRSAQKGVGGDVVPQENMPWTQSGIIPDVIFSPTSFASRMTVSMVAEILMGSVITTCDTRRLVSNLIKWDKGMPKPIFRDRLTVLDVNAIDKERKPTYTESNDFWIVLIPIFVSLQPNIEIDNHFLRISEMEQMALAYTDILPIDKTSLKLLINDYIESIKSEWKLSYGIRFDVDLYKEKYSIPATEFITMLKTNERAILFSQMPPNMQIKWYLEHKHDVVPNYLMRVPREESKTDFSDATAFRPPSYEDAQRILKEKGFRANGEEFMYSGVTGKVTKMSIFTGPCHWMHLKHLVDSKQQTRDQGARSVVSRAATKGKALGGAVRAGEMSHSAMMAHNAMDYLAERFLHAADKFEILLCTDPKCGGEYYIGIVGSISKCQTCGSDEMPLKTTVPYASIRFLGMLTATGQRPHYIIKEHPDIDINPNIGFDEDEDIETIIFKN